MLRSSAVCGLVASSVMLGAQHSVTLCCNMDSLHSWRLLSLTVTLLSIGDVCAEETDDGPEVKYAVIGACVGAILAVSFIAIKLYMIKKHMLDNNFSDILSLVIPSGGAKLSSPKPRTFSQSWTIPINMDMGRC